MFKHRLSRYLAITAAGWAILMLGIALWVLLQAASPNFNSEIGAFGAFLFLAYFFSIYYLIAAFVVGVVCWCIKDSISWRCTVVAPNNSFKPKPLRGSA